jgi:acyl-ACP thioesterase
MDAATRHADEMGIGRAHLRTKDLFWMVTKTKIKVFDMPEMSDLTTMITWPLRPQRMHNDRCYVLEKDGKVLACGKTEWVNYNFVTGKLSPVSELFPADTEFCEEDPVPEGFDRISGEFPEKVCEFRVRTSDVDVNGHMNNTKYVYSLLDIYTTEELKAHPVKQAEVIYKNQAREGEVLTISRRVNPDGTEDLKLSAEDRTIVFARFERG